MANEPQTRILKQMASNGLIKISVDEHGDIDIRNFDETAIYKLDKQEFNEFVMELIGYGISTGCYKLGCRVGQGSQISISLAGL